ncbi:hypothetical protein CBL_09094 [Carabus blaptoides fortunei]
MFGIRRKTSRAYGEEVPPTGTCDMNDGRFCPRRHHQKHLEEDLLPSYWLLNLNELLQKDHYCTGPVNGVFTRLNENMKSIANRNFSEGSSQNQTFTHNIGGIDGRNFPSIYRLAGKVELVPCAYIMSTQLATPRVEIMGTAAAESARPLPAAGHNSNQSAICRQRHRESCVIYVAPSEHCDRCGARYKILWLNTTIITLAQSKPDPS